MPRILDQSVLSWHTKTTKEVADMVYTMIIGDILKRISTKDPEFGEARIWARERANNIASALAATVIT